VRKQLNIDTTAVRITAYQFDHACSRSYRKFEHRYAELWKLFRSTLTFDEIGSILSITKQAAHQLHDRWFSQYLGPGSERTRFLRQLKRQIERETALEQKLAAARTNPLFVYISESAREHGHELEPVIDYEGTGVLASSTPVYRDGERYVRIYHRYAEFRPSQHSTQSYASFQISLSMLTEIYACILFSDIPGFGREIFVVRANLLRNVIKDNGARVWNFYIALGGRKVQTSKVRVDLRKFKDAWWVLDL